MDVQTVYTYYYTRCEGDLCNDTDGTGGDDDEVSRWHHCDDDDDDGGPCLKPKVLYPWVTSASPEAHKIFPNGSPEGHTQKCDYVFFSKYRVML